MEQTIVEMLKKALQTTTRSFVKTIRTWRKKPLGHAVARALTLLFKVLIQPSHPQSNDIAEVGPVSTCKFSPATFNSMCEENPLTALLSLQQLFSANGYRIKILVQHSCTLYRIFTSVTSWTG